MNTITNNQKEEEVYGSAGINAFMSLAKFISLCEKEKPTLEAVDKALTEFQVMYGATSEEELLKTGMGEEVKVYHELKTVLNKLL